MYKFIENYKQHNQSIIKEVLTLFSSLFTFFEREFEDSENKQKIKIDQYKRELKSLYYFETLPKILNESETKPDIFLIFINQLLEIGILEPHYFVDHDVFGVLRECLKTKSHIKFLYVSNIITILLR